MSSQAGSREDGRRLSLRTLVIASIASASAAVVTSLFWKGGTPIAAAVTPVIVTVVSEMLHRPTEKIASRFTSETDALPAEAAGAGAPPPRGRHREEPPAREATARREQTAAREERLRTLPATAADPARSPGAPEMKVYRSPSRRPRLAFKPIAATAAIAFVIAAALLTLPELIAGQSFGQGDRGTTLFGGSGQTSDQDTQEETQPQPQETAPDQPDESQPQDTQDQKAPTEPPAEQPPDVRQAPATTTPAPAAPGEPAP